MVSNLYYTFLFSTVAIFCFYIEYISKNAIYYLHFVNGVSILCGLIIVIGAVDSPIRCLDQGRVSECFKNLEFISWFNSKFSKHRAYYFEDVSITDPKNNITDTQGSEDLNKPVFIKKVGAWTLLKQIIGGHWQVFILLIFIKMNIDVVWFLNVFVVQGNTKGDNSIFYNGMILGLTSYAASFSCGFIMKWLSFYKLEIYHGLTCVFIAVFKLSCHYLKDSMSPDVLSLTNKISILMCYVVTFNLDQLFNCYMECNLALIPPRL